MTGKLRTVLKVSADNRVVCNRPFEVSIIETYKIILTRNKFTAIVYHNEAKELLCVI